MKTPRSKALAAVLMATVLALAGCMSIEANVDVGKDNKIDGTMSVKMSKQLAALAGINSADALKEQMDSEGDTPAGLTYETSEDDQNYIITMKGDLSDTDGMMTATSQGDVQTFTVTNTQSEQAGGGASATPTDLPTTLPSELPSDLASALPSDLASALPSATGTDNPFSALAGDYKLEVTANFAGTVTAVSGDNATKIDDDTVKFSGPIAEKWTSSATIDLAGGPLSSKGMAISPMLLLLGGAFLLLLLAVLIIVLVMRARRPKAPTQPMAPPGWPAEGVAGPDQPYAGASTDQTIAYPTAPGAAGPMAPPSAPAPPPAPPQYGPPQGQPPASMAPPSAPAPPPAPPQYGPPQGQPPAPPQYGPPQGQPPAPPQYGPPQGQPPAPPQYGPPQGQPPAPPQ